MNDSEKINVNENVNDESIIDYNAVNQDIKEHGKSKMMVSVMKKQDKSRINAFISNRNYKFIDELMSKGELISMKLSKGAILDLALTNLFISLKNGESLEDIAINHLERGD